MKIITIARKPLSEKNVASNVLKHCCGALNIDGCRIETEVDTRRDNNFMGYHGNVRPFTSGTESGGRWPSNLLIDGSDEVVGCFPETGPYTSHQRKNKAAKAFSFGAEKANITYGHSDNGGSAARFFKQFKVDK